jgi:hypothetical protein
MQVETLQVKDWPRNMNRHLKKCPACAQTARALYQIEESWRNQPLPAECAKAKAAFLEKLPTLEQPKPEKLEKTSRRRKRAKTIKMPVRRSSPYRWLAVAAVLLFGVILVGQLLPKKAQASSDVIERLIDLELEMTNADAKERKRLLEEKEPAIKKELEKGILSDEERKLAEELLDDARKLASAADEVAEAEVVKQIADHLFSRCQSHDKPGHEKELELCGKRYMRFKEYGYEPTKARITKSGPDRSGFKAADKGGNELLWKQVEKIFEHSPEHARPDLHKKFEHFSKKDGGSKKPGGKK